MLQTANTAFKIPEDLKQYITQIQPPRFIFDIGTPDGSSSQALYDFCFSQHRIYPTIFATGIKGNPPFGFKTPYHPIITKAEIEACPVKQIFAFEAFADLKETDVPAHLIVHHLAGKENIDDIAQQEDRYQPYLSPKGKVFFICPS